MLMQRVLTAVVLVPLMLTAIYWLPNHFFAAFTGCILLLAMWEWANLSGFSQPLIRWLAAGAMALLLFGLFQLDLHATSAWPLLVMLSLSGWLLAFVLVVTYPQSQSIFRPRWFRLALAAPVLLPFWLGLNALKNHPDAELVLTWLMLLVWGADIGAYFAGRAWGQRKLAVAVSPGKTWAGAYGGMVVAMLLSVAIAWLALPVLTLWQWLLLLFISSLVVAISILGDLLESLLKRYRGIKDSSALLPGHGGVLDRIDSLCAATPMFCLLLWLIGY